MNLELLRRLQKSGFELMLIPTVTLLPGESGTELPARITGGGQPPTYSARCKSSVIDRVDCRLICQQTANAIDEPSVASTALATHCERLVSGLNPRCSAAAVESRIVDRASGCRIRERGAFSRQTIGVTVSRDIAGHTALSSDGYRIISCRNPAGHIPIACQGRV